MSLFTSGEGSGTTVEVEGDRRTGLHVNSGELAVLIQIGLTVNQVTQRSNLVLQGSDLVLEFCILFLQSGHLVCQGVVLIRGERNRDNHRSDGAVTVEVGLTKVEGNTDGSGYREVEVGKLVEELADSVVAGNNIIHLIVGSLCRISAEINVEVDAAGKTELIEDTETPNPVTLDLTVNIQQIQTGGDIRNHIPDAGLFVTAEGVSGAPEEVTVDNVLGNDIALLVILNTVPAQTAADERGPPFTCIDIHCQTTLTGDERNARDLEGIQMDGPVCQVKTCIPTNTNADERVVKGLVGLISTADDVAVLVAIGILLSESAGGEEEACCCKDSKDSFDTFHNKVLTLI